MASGCLRAQSEQATGSRTSGCMAFARAEATKASEHRSAVVFVHLLATKDFVA